MLTDIDGHLPYYIGMIFTAGGIETTVNYTIQSIRSKNKARNLRDALSNGDTLTEKDLSGISDSKVDTVATTALKRHLDANRVENTAELLNILNVDTANKKRVTEILCDPDVEINVDIVSDFDRSGTLGKEDLPHEWKNDDAIILDASLRVLNENKKVIGTFANLDQCLYHSADRTRGLRKADIVEDFNIITTDGEVAHHENPKRRKKYTRIRFLNYIIMVSKEQNVEDQKLTGESKPTSITFALQSQILTQLTGLPTK